MGSAGPFVFVAFVAFMLYFLWSIKDVEPAEVKWEFYAVLCAKPEFQWEKKTICITKTRPLAERPNAMTCQRAGTIQVAKWLGSIPGTTVRKFGCRRRELGV